VFGLFAAEFPGDLDPRLLSGDQALEASGDKAGPQCVAGPSAKPRLVGWPDGSGHLSFSSKRAQVLSAAGSAPEFPSSHLAAEAGAEAEAEARLGLEVVQGVVVGRGCWSAG
jgi:hypothetical protein